MNPERFDEIESQLNEHQEKLDELQDTLEDIRDNIDLQRGEPGPQGKQGPAGKDGKPGRDGKDGKDGEPGKDGRDGRDGKDGVDGRDGQDGKDADEDKVIKEVLKKIPKPSFIDRTPIFGRGGGSSVFVKENGVTKGRGGSINFIAGSGVEINVVDQGNDSMAVIVSSSVSGLQLMHPTGDINSSNTDFVFTQKPNYIVSDGAWYKENKGWTWNTGTLTATMIIPPNDDLYGFI